MNTFQIIASSIAIIPIQYPVDLETVVDFIENNKNEFDSLRNYLTKEKSQIALSIVAPEIGQYSRMFDFLEVKTLALLYVQQNLSDFSIGPFQMKPSFAVSIEREIKNRKEIKMRHRGLLISGGTDKNKRRIRIERLSQLSWQIKYLAAFVDIVEELTKEMSFASTEDKLQYWATLYNAGIYLDEVAIKKKQGMTEYPHFGKEYNYSVLVLAYYNELKELF